MTSDDKILTAIRGGLTRTHELADKTELPENHVCQVCNHLVRLRVVHRETDADGYVYTPRDNWEKRTLK